jgi:sporulation protein YlmC with PRC-barrel domain
MKRNIKKLTGFKIGATNGEIGHVNEFYFDDASWTIRYLVVETGSWLSGRKVLISPEAFLTPDWDNKVFPVALTQEQVKNSPDIDTEQPVSRQEEIRLNQHYPWKKYWEGGLWGGGVGTVGMVMPAPIDGDQTFTGEDQADLPEPPAGDQHLRSTGKTAGYTIKAADGSIGEVQDFIVDDTSWQIDYLVVDTGSWLPGKKVLISPQWITNIDWLTSVITVSATVSDVKGSPEYDPENPLDDTYASKLTAHYNPGTTQASGNRHSQPL